MRIAFFLGRALSCVREDDLREKFEVEQDPTKGREMDPFSQSYRRRVPGAVHARAKRSKGLNPRSDFLSPTRWLRDNIWRWWLGSEIGCDFVTQTLGRSRATLGVCLVDQDSLISEFFSTPCTHFLL